jgi:hypothetical protein
MGASPASGVADTLGRFASGGLFVAALGDLSERRLQRWRMIDSVAKRLGVSWDEAEAAANEAAAKGLADDRGWA